MGVNSLECLAVNRLVIVIVHNCAVVYVDQHTETPDVFLRMVMKSHRWTEIKYHMKRSSFSNS